MQLDQADICASIQEISNVNALQIKKNLIILEKYCSEYLIYNLLNIFM